MNPKIISAIISALISFIFLVGLSFFMDKFINNSQLEFIEFLKQKWMYFVAIVLIFTIYTNFIKGRKIQK